MSLELYTRDFSSSQSVYFAIHEKDFTEKRPTSWYAIDWSF